MPFIGRDWRSPGEAWVKTDEGSWEKLKILETSVYNRNRNHPNENGFYSSGDSSTESDSESDSGDAGELPESSKLTQCKKQSGACETVNVNNLLTCASSPSSPVCWPPYCQITLKSTKEVAGYNTMSEAFYRLDFTSALCDIRRFNYVTKLLHLLINNNLTNLSGCATKVLFNMLERLALQVASDKQNIHVLQRLLDDLKKIVHNYYCWGRPIGSTVLWQNHLETLEKICTTTASIEIEKPDEDGSKRLSDLPEELIREILLRLSDYKDLVSASDSCRVMTSLLNEQHIWRQLCKYHFTRLQVRSTVNQATDSQGKVDWEQAFQLLRRKYTLKEEYAETLVLCRHCRCLFWKSFGHPCVNDDFKDKLSPPGENELKDGDESRSPSVASVPLHIPVPPEAFLKFFSL